MSTIKVDADKVVPKVTASLLPMHIQHSGAANTAEYFTPSHTTETLRDGSTISTAFFRGCRLIGKDLNLLEQNLQGFVMNSSELLIREENLEDGTETIKSVKSYTPVATFDKLVLFGHDEEVEPNDQWRLITEFLKISNILHS